MAKAGADVLVVTIDQIPGRTVAKVFGVVSATSNNSTHSQSFVHFIENESQARTDATELLQAKAEKLGANAIVGIRYNDHIHTLGSDGETCSYFSLITAFGTAVLLE